MNKKLEYEFTLLSNEKVGRKTYLMQLTSPSGAPGDIIATPGQFVNIKVDGYYLRRPISVCDWDGKVLTLLYDVVGDGTSEMSRWKKDRRVNILAPLGNGFDVEACGNRPLLVGGGIGVAPLYWLAREIIIRGGSPTIVLGYNTAADVIYENEFRSLTPDVFIATAAGDAGVKGFVTDVPSVKQGNEFTGYCACGPMPMLRALGQLLPERGQLSLDERMACGFGVCMCCSLETKNGAKRICKDGPVFRTEDLIWK